MATAATALQLQLNGSTAISSVVPGSSNGQVEIVNDDMSKLAVMMYNGDTAAATMELVAGGDIMLRSGLTALSTSVGSSAYVWFGPFDSMQYKSTSGEIQFNFTSTASTLVQIWAWYLP